MTSIMAIFRKHNFILLDKILNNGDFVIEANGFIDPNSEIFNKPYNQISNDRNNHNCKAFKS
jgi:hypothetical protein